MSDQQRIVRHTIHALAIALPLASTNVTWLPFVSSSITFDEYDTAKVFVLYSLVLTGLAAWAYRALRHGAELRHVRADWLVLGLLGWALITTVFSTHIPTSILGQYRRYDGLLTLAAYASVYFLALQTVVTPQERRSLARTICISGAVVALYGVGQYAGFDPLRHTELPFDANQAYSTMGNPNLLGGYLLFPLTLGAVLALSESRLGWRTVYWVCVLLAGVALLATLTRGAWIAGVVALATVAIAFFRSSLRPTWVDGAFAATGVIGGVALAIRSMSTGSSTTNIFDRVASVFRFGEGSALQRTQVWEGAVSSIRDSPLVGHGPDTFRLIFPRFRPQEILTDWGWESTADNSHNYVLQTASGMGIPGALLLYAFFVYVLVSSALRAFSRERPPQALILLGFWAAALGYLVHLMFGISVVGSTALLWICAGVLLGPSAHTRTLAAPVWGRIAGIVVVVFATAGIAASAMIPVADHYFLEANQAPTLDARYSGARQAIRLDPLLAVYRPQPGDVHLAEANSWLAQANADIGAGRSEKVSLSNALSASREAIRAYEAAIEFAPAESENYANLAIASNQAGQIDPTYYAKTLDAVAHGLEVDPHNPVLRVHGSLAHFRLGQMDEAIALAQEAAKIDPNYARPHTILGDVYAAQGRVDEAMVEYNTALALDPADLAARKGIERLTEGTPAQCG